MACYISCRHEQHKASKHHTHPGHTYLLLQNILFGVFCMIMLSTQWRIGYLIALAQRCLRHHHHGRDHEVNIEINFLSQMLLQTFVIVSCVVFSVFQIEVMEEKTNPDSRRYALDELREFKEQIGFCESFSCS